MFHKHNHIVSHSDNFPNSRPLINQGVKGKLVEQLPQRDSVIVCSKLVGKFHVVFKQVVCLTAFSVARCSCHHPD